MEPARLFRRRLVRPEESRLEIMVIALLERGRHWWRG